MAASLAAATVMAVLGQARAQTTLEMGYMPIVP